MVRRPHRRPGSSQRRELFAVVVVVVVGAHGVDRERSREVTHGRVYGCAGCASKNRQNTFGAEWPSGLLLPLGYRWVSPASTRTSTRFPSLLPGRRVRHTRIDRLANLTATSGGPRRRS